MPEATQDSNQQQEQQQLQPGRALAPGLRKPPSAGGQKRVTEEVPANPRKRKGATALKNYAIAMGVTGGSIIGALKLIF